MAQTEILDLVTSSDEEPPVKPVKPAKSVGFIDLTIELSDDEGIPDISEALNAANASQARVPPRPNGTSALPRTQVPRQQTPIEDPSSHSDTSVFKQKKRKKRSLNNQNDAAFRMASPSPQNNPQRRISNAKRANDAFNRAEDEEPIKRPSHVQKKGLKVMQRLAGGTKNAGESSAPKVKAGTVKQSSKNKTVPAEKVPKKISTVKKVLNAPLESLVPTAPRTDTTKANNSTNPNDNPLPEDDFQDFHMEPLSPLRAPSFSPPPLPSPPPSRRNLDYRPYSPTAASRGAGPSSRADLYVALPPAGWHSRSAAAYPYLPRLPRNPITPRPKPDSFVPSTDAGPSTSHKPNKGRKRNRTIRSDTESDDQQPPKKRKHSTGEDDEDVLSKSLDRILESVISKPPADEMETTDTIEQGLGETDEEVDQLVESAFEDDPEPPQLDEPATPPSAYVEEDSERPGFLDDGNDPDTQMGTSASKPADIPCNIQENDGNEADLEDSANQKSNLNSAPRRLPPSLDRDPEEEKLKRLLDSYSDVLDKYPSHINGYRRPGLSPRDAPWVILRPFLERKLQLERIKLQKQKGENGI